MATRPQQKEKTAHSSAQVPVKLRVSAKSPSKNTEKPAKNADKQNKISTIAFVSLGCPKNLVDSEKMLGLLAEDGLTPVADHADADAIVINTCGFLEASKIESIQEIQQAAELKKSGSCKRIIVAGCLVQRHRAKMLEWCPDIDALIGVFDRDHIVDAVRGSRPVREKIGAESSHEVPVYSSIAANATVAKRARHIDAEGYFEDDSARLRLTPRHYAYLRMSEGCNQNCAFCTIPSIRGKMRSKPVDRIIAEARELWADGVFELNLIGQDTTSYGKDIGYDAPHQGLVGLLEALNEAASENHEGNAVGGWIRLMYAYPSCFTDEMIDAIARLPHVLKYIDMPLQHINDQVLDRMRRKTSRKLIETLLNKLQKRIPGMAIRTTFITGFPGETKAQHRELVKFLRDFEGGFEAMGVFPYSPEPGTPAGTLYENGGAIPQKVVEERLEELMLTQQEIVFARNKKLALEKTTMDVLIDAVTPTKGKKTTGVSNAGRLYTGRTVRQAPQIDSMTHVHSRHALSPGQIVRCHIVDFDGYDLIAQPLPEMENTVPLTVL